MVLMETMATDNIPVLANDLVELTGNVLPDDVHAVVIKDENLVKKHQLLSMYARIFNYQSLGFGIQLTLPIENLHNLPFCALRVSPLWPSIYASIRRHMSLQKGYHAPGCMHILQQLMGFIWPGDNQSRSYLDTTRIPENVTYIEHDDPPDISMYAHHSMAWTGGLSFQFKVLSNVTTQGHIAISRGYNVERSPIFQPSNYRTQVSAPLTSQNARWKNGVTTLNMSHPDDVYVDCPYVEDVPQKFLSQFLNRVCSADGEGSVQQQYVARDSYLWFDLLGILDKSASAGTITIFPFIKAMDDFQFMGMQPISRGWLDTKYSHVSRVSTNLVPPIRFGSEKASNYYITKPDEIIYLQGAQRYNFADDSGPTLLAKDPIDPSVFTYPDLNKLSLGKIPASKPK